MSKQEIEEIEGLSSEFKVTHVSPGDFEAGWTPPEPVDVILTETSGHLASWDLLPGILLGRYLQPLLTEHLQFIQLCSVGVEQVAGMIPDRIRVANAAGVHADAIAETVMGGILFHYKRFRDRLHYQAAHEYRALDCQELRDKTICVVGPGSIGQAVASRARAFGPRIVGVRRSGTAGVTHFDEIVAVGDLQAALEGADILVVATPLTPETEGLIGAEALGALNDGAYVVNVARGAIVQEDVLIEALQSGRLSGALLDAHVDEPLPVDHPFWDLQNVLVLPHDSHSTPFIGTNMLALFRENLQRWTEGRSLRNEVDFARGY